MGCLFSIETTPNNVNVESNQSPKVPLSTNQQIQLDGEEIQRQSLIRRISSTITTMVVPSRSLNIISSMSSISVTTVRSNSGFLNSAEGSTLNPIISRNVLESRVVVTNDVEKFATDLVQESRRIFRIYAGLDNVLGISFKWNVRSTHSNITVSSANVFASKYLVIKSTGRCRADKYTTTKLLYDITRVSEYEDNIENYEVLYNLDPKSSIRRFTYKKISPVSARDAVVITTWTELDDASIIITTLSVPTIWHPPPKSIVRAFVHSSGAIIRPLTDGGCEITFITHCDVGGYVPTAILNRIMVGTPIKTMTKVISLAEGDIKKETKL